MSRINAQYFRPSDEIRTRPNAAKLGRRSSRSWEVGHSPVDRGNMSTGSGSRSELIAAISNMLRKITWSVTTFLSRLYIHSCIDSERSYWPWIQNDNVTQKAAIPLINCTRCDSWNSCHCNSDFSLPWTFRNLFK